MEMGRMAYGGKLGPLLIGDTSMLKAQDGGGSVGPCVGEGVREGWWTVRVNNGEEE